MPVNSPLPSRTQRQRWRRVMPLVRAPSRRRRRVSSSSRPAGAGDACGKDGAQGTDVARANARESQVDLRAARSRPGAAGPGVTCGTLRPREVKSPVRTRLSANGRSGRPAPSAPAPRGDRGHTGPIDHDAHMAQPQRARTTVARRSAADRACRAAARRACARARTQRPRAAGPDQAGSGADGTPPHGTRVAGLGGERPAAASRRQCSCRSGRRASIQSPGRVGVPRHVVAAVRHGDPHTMSARLLGNHALVIAVVAQGVRVRVFGLVSAVHCVPVSEPSHGRRTPCRRGCRSRTGPAAACRSGRRGPRTDRRSWRSRSAGRSSAAAAGRPTARTPALPALLMPSSSRFQVPLARSWATRLTAPDRSGPAGSAESTPSGSSLDDGHELVLQPRVRGLKARGRGR